MTVRAFTSPFAVLRDSIISHFSDVVKGKFSRTHEKGIGMNLYDKILYLCKERNVSVASVERACGFSHGVLRRWNVQHPSAERLRKVSDFFGVTTAYLLDETDDREVEYYIDPEVAQIAQELKDRPELKVLFDASRNVKKEDIELVATMIRRMSGDD